MSKAVIVNLLYFMAHIIKLPKFCGTPKKIVFSNLTKNRYNFVHSHLMAIVVLAVAIF